MLQEHFYIIKAEDLTAICEAAYLWFKNHNETYHTFTVEEKFTKRLRDELFKVNWDENARLIIDEL